MRVAGRPFRRRARGLIAEEPQAPRRRGRRVAILLAFGVAGLVLALYVADAVLASNRVPRGVTVASPAAGPVALGGQRPAVAERTLTAGLAEATRRPLQVRAQGRAFAVDPAVAGLSIDARATVGAARDRSWQPAAVLRRVLGLRTTVAPRVAAEPARLRAAVLTVAAAVDQPAQAGGIAFRGLVPVVTQPAAGERLDVAAAEAAIRSAYLRRTAPLTLPSRRGTPAVSAAQLQAALATLARPAVAAPVTLTAGGKSAVLPPSAIAAGLTITPDAAGQLHPYLNGPAVLAAAGSSARGLATPARDAKFTFVKGRPVLVPSQIGRRLDPSALSVAVLPVLARPAPRTVPVTLAATQPSLSTAAAGKLSIREKVSTFTTRHPCCRPRVTNIHRIADIVGGALVLPGKTFSLNGYVGPRDRARGFVSAPMISDGQFQDAVGGGVSQFSTTIFNAVFFGGFQDVQHKPHSYYISRYPAGRESTVSYPQPDFRFRNDSPYGVLIQTAYTGTSITVSFWSTKRYDITSASSGRYAYTYPSGTGYNTRPDCESSSGAPGFQIDVTRIFSRGGAVVKREKFHTRYLTQPRVVCGSPPAPDPAPTPTPAATP